MDKQPLGRCRVSASFEGLCSLAWRFMERDAGLVFVADDLAAWLLALFADAGRRRLANLVLGSAQERALKQAAAAAVRLTVGELCREDSSRAEGLEMVISQVFGDPVPETRLDGCTTMLEAVQAGIAGQLAVLDDAGLTGTPESSAELLGVSAAVLTEKLTTHLVRQIVSRGARGGPLEPLAAQLNHDATHLQAQRIEEILHRLADDVRDVLARLDTSNAMAASPVPTDAQEFDELLAEPVVGREWLTAEIDAFCDEHDRGYFLIEGDAGMGKTTFAAWLAREKQCPAHFAQLDPDAATAAGAARNIGAKLIADWDLTEPRADVPREAASAAWLRSLLGAAARRRDEIAPGTPIVVVVDALDADIEPPDLHMPLGLPDRLPGGVYVVATVRTGSLRYVPEGCARRVLDAALDENLADLRRYLAQARDEPYLADAITKAGMSPAEFSGMLLERSAGIWIYVRYVLEEIRQDPRTVRALPDLPRGLEGYYNNNLARLCNGPDGTGLYIPLLASLAAAAEPVNARTLAAFAGIGDWLRAELVLDGALRPYCVVRRLSGESRRLFKIRHPSLAEYLTGSIPVNVSAETSIGTTAANVSALRAVLAGACKETHNRICDRYLAAWGGLNRHLPDLEAAPELGGMDGGYALRWLATHLLVADRTADLHCLLACGPRGHNTWFAAHDRVRDEAEYLHDVRSARRSTQRLGMQIHYALVEASFASLSTALPPSLIGALVSRGLWSASRAFSHIRQMTDERRQAQALALIASCLPREVLGPALSVAMSCEQDENRIRALGAVIPHLPGDQVEAAVEALLSIEHNTDVLLPPIVAVASSLPRELLSKLSEPRDWPFSRKRFVQATLVFFASDDRSQGARRALAVAWAIHNDYERCWLIAILVPYFPEDAFHEVLAVLGASSSADYLNVALTALAKHCPAGRLEDLLAFAVDKEPDPEFYKEVAPQLTKQQLSAALEMCRAEHNEAKRVEAFIALTPCLSSDQAREFLAMPPEGYMPLSPNRRWNMSVAKFLQLFNEDRLPVVGALLERLPEQEARAVLNDLITSGRLWPRIRTMASFIRDLPTQSLPRFARYLPSDGLRSSRLTGICNEMRNFRREELARLLIQFAPFSDDEITEIFDIVGRAWWPGARVVVAEVLAPHLTDRQLGHVLARVVAFPLENECFTALAQLGRFQTPRTRDRTAERALAIVAGLSDNQQKAQALAELVPVLLRPDLVARAFEIARSMAPSFYWIARAMNGLAPALPADLLRAVPGAISGRASPDPAKDIPQILEQLSAEGDTAVIDTLLPRIPEPEHNWHVSSCATLCRLAPYLSASQARRVWHIGDPDTFGHAQAEALAALVIRLPEHERTAAADEILASYTPDRRGQLREAQVLGRLARATSTQLLTHALRGFLTGPERVRTQIVLEEFVPGLPESLIPDAFQYAMSDSYDSCRALARLAPRLSGPLLTEAISYVSEGVSRTGRAAALTALARQLPPPDRHTVLALALEAAISWPADSRSTRVMPELIPQLPEWMRPRAVSAVTDELCSDLRHHRQLDGEEFDRLRAVLAILRGPELEQLYAQFWQVATPRVRAHAQSTLIRQAAEEHTAGFLARDRPLYYDWPGDLDRAGVMELIAASGWWIDCNGDDTSIDETIEAIFTVTRWWP
jgi:hypothetical protein